MIKFSQFIEEQKQLTEARTSLPAVNKRLKKHGYELVKGSGYFYFSPLGKAKELYDSSVSVTKINQMTPDEWEKELIRKTKEFGTGGGYSGTGKITFKF